jgi:ssDNA-binding Zn-finger/Zn-ribbon topoisomerase 1
MNERRKLRCPECGAEMNFHAEKLDLSRSFEGVAEADPELGGVLVEIHTCPACKFVLERPAG